MGIQWTYNDIYIYNQQCGDLMSEDGVYHQHGYFFGDNDSNWLGWGSLFSVEPFFFNPVMLILMELSSSPCLFGLFEVIHIFMNQSGTGMHIMHIQGIQVG
jgi:hypothetical protein